MRGRDYGADGMALRYHGESVEEPLFQPGKIIGKVWACGVRDIRDRMCFERPAVFARHQQFQIGLANVENCDPGRGCR